MLNGLFALVIESGHSDPAYIAARTPGLDRPRETVRAHTPERVEALSVAPRDGALSYRPA